MNHSTTSDREKIQWALETYEFLCDSLTEEVSIHPHRDELLTLMEEQLLDDTNLNCM